MNAFTDLIFSNRSGKVESFKLGDCKCRCLVSDNHKILGVVDCFRMSKNHPVLENLPDKIFVTKSDGTYLTDVNDIPVNGAVPVTEHRFEIKF